MKPKFVKHLGYKTYNSKEVESEKREETKADEAVEEVEEAPVPLVTHVNNNLPSIFSNLEVYMNNQQIYHSIVPYARNSYFSNNFKGTISKYKGVLDCDGNDYDEFLEEIMEAPSSEPFSTRRMKMLAGPEDFLLYGKLGINFFSTSEFLFPQLKVRIRLIEARPKLYTISDNLNVSLGIVDCSFYTRLIVLRDDYHKKRMEMLAYNPVDYN